MPEKHQAAAFNSCTRKPTVIAHRSLFVKDQCKAFSTASTGHALLVDTLGPQALNKRAPWRRISCLSASPCAFAVMPDSEVTTHMMRRVGSVRRESSAGLRRGALSATSPPPATGDPRACPQIERLERSGPRHQLPDRSHRYEASKVHRKCQT